MQSLKNVPKFRENKTLAKISQFKVTVKIEHLLTHSVKYPSVCILAFLKVVFLLFISALLIILKSYM